MTQTEEKLFATGAIRKEEHEADERDFVASTVLGMPADISAYTKTINRTNMIKETINQGCVPRCTASSLCHNLTIQNAIEEKSIDIFVDDVRQWIDNQGKMNTCTGESGDYLEEALKGLKNNGVPGAVKGQPFVFHIDGYAHQARTFTNRSYEQIQKEITYYLTEKKPLYCAFKGNRTVSKEIDLDGERKTFIKQSESTYGHAVIMTGAVRNDGKIIEYHFINSRSRNKLNAEGNKKLSSFKMSGDLFEKLLRAGIFGRRYRVTYDAPNYIEPPLFVDYPKGEEEEHTIAVKFVKENQIIKGVPSKNSGQLFVPNGVFTRLQGAIVAYRICMFLMKYIDQAIEKIVKKYLEK